MVEEARSYGIVGKEEAANLTEVPNIGHRGNIQCKSNEGIKIRQVCCSPKGEITLGTKNVDLSYPAVFWRIAPCRQ